MPASAVSNDISTVSCSFSILLGIISLTETQEKYGQVNSYRILSSNDELYLGGWVHCRLTCKAFGFSSKRLETYSFWLSPISSRKNDQLSVWAVSLCPIFLATISLKSGTNPSSSSDLDCYYGWGFSLINVAINMFLYPTSAAPSPDTLASIGKVSFMSCLHRWMCQIFCMRSMITWLQHFLNYIV